MKKIYAVIVLFATINSSYAQSNIVGYEYWFNNDFANKTTTRVTATQQLMINQTVPTTGLFEGVNTFNFRSFDNLGKYSSILSHFFYKTSALESNPTPKILAYEYWLNNDYANAVLVNTPIGQQININELISMSTLNNGVHNFNIRFKDNAGMWSSVMSHFFYKTSALESNPTPKIVAYEYWLNNDYANAVVVNTPIGQQVNINELISMRTLNNGLHNFNIRFKDNNNLWSSVMSHFFYKTSALESNPTPKIVAYEYWLNNDYANAVLVNTPIGQQVNINELISMSTLNNGVHNFNFRFKDNAGMWSSVVSHLFYKTPEQVVTQNMITSYRYWFGGDVRNAVYISLNPQKQINVLDSIDLTRLPKGIYEINFQFKDTLGKWSVVLTETIEKKSLTIADFLYSAMQYCDSTVITFANKSIDGNDFLWDFGDGNASDLTNPTHTFYAPNTYQVRLTTTDTILGTNSTIVVPVVINSLHTFSTITETACVSYIAPDGQVYTTSGIKTAIIPNAVGCDSTITINLTINTVDVSVTQNGIMLSANATADSYQWLDCNNGNSIISGETNQSFTATQNGSYAVKVTQNSCTVTSSCHAVTTVGIFENTFSNEIKVYPNPTDGILKIDLGETLSEFVVSIIDVNGKLIRQSTYKNTSMFELNLNVQPGIYMLRINSENKKATIRLIKN